MEGLLGCTRAENRETERRDSMRCDATLPPSPYTRARRTEPERARKHVNRRAQTLNVLSLYALSRLVPVTREDKVARGTTFLSNSLPASSAAPSRLAFVRETVFPASDCDAIGQPRKAATREFISADGG